MAMAEATSSPPTNDGGNSGEGSGESGGALVRLPSVCARDSASSKPGVRFIVISPLVDIFATYNHLLLFSCILLSFVVVDDIHFRFGGANGEACKCRAGRSIHRCGPAVVYWRCHWNRVYVAEYVTNWFLNKYPQLVDSFKSPKNSNWIDFVSKGNLKIPSDNLFQAVQIIEKHFKN
ncbi:Uncharacterized protein FWK35_00029083 [Aphis craccivora]|uniref:Uncharacterized protein n=1 Tax=Aphis craccivora TaxID=307492 RepID=A0A6G0YGM4_APHCR|nr:Uncharacterized protein FWK35_00029083 [Aphis craccivora]